MYSLSWLHQLARKWFPRQRRQRRVKRERRSSVRLGVEVLEDRLAPAALVTLASFVPNPNGATPNTSLVVDSSGNLFGTTNGGGTNGDGTVFEVAAGSHAITTLVSLTGTSGSYLGAQPKALVADSSGNLFGTTGGGGTANDGTVFEVAAGTHTFTTLVSFTGTGGPDLGLGPENLVFDGSGNLFGTTSGGGTANDGTVFEVAAGTHAFTSLVSFTGQSGSFPGLQPTTPLVVDNSGNLFGTTLDGGTNFDGTVFEVAAGTHTFTSLVSFTGQSGAFPGLQPRAPLVVDSSGNLFGTTDGGGTNFDGTIFELAAGTHTFTSLVSFTGQSGSFPGSQPTAALIVDSSGNRNRSHIGEQ